MERTKFRRTIEYCIEKVDKGIETLELHYPASASVNGVYESIENIDWTNGFWTGMLWLAYEFTGKDKYKKEAMWQVKDFLHRIENHIAVDHHDMGFLYLPSCVAAYKLTGSEVGKKAAIMAADNLCRRFQEKGKFIQAWGALGERNNYRLIIDCLLNIPLLFWAYEETGIARYKEIALAHLTTSVGVVIRPDGSTHHTYFFDPVTGKPDHGETSQGYSDTSIWARGQAWGIYGLAIAYRYTKDPELIDKFKLVTEVFISHLPDDNIPAWDMIFTDISTIKDSSSAAIAICGILEMAKHWDLPDTYLKKADDMMNALIDKCLTSDIFGSNGILKHATYSMSDMRGVDECNIWGDYYFMEALMRYTNMSWNSYWD